MSWLNKLLGKEPKQVNAPPPPLAESDHEALDAMKVEHRRILSRADAAIKEAMAHADTYFQPTPYRGPERRARPR